METKGIEAIVTLKENKDRLDGGRASVFYVEDKEELEYTAMIISRITDTVAHDLDNQIYILVDH